MGTNDWREKAPWVPLKLDGQLISRPGARDAKQYLEVAAQFDVMHNPRYQAYSSAYDLPPRTYCNIYVWDVTRAMQAEIPHWADIFKRSAEMAAPGSFELNANDMIEWLFEGRVGWRKLVDSREAYAIADTGRPVVAGWHSPLGSIGHIAMVMPGEVIAQAGRNNLWLEPLSHGFSALKPVFFGHD